MKVDEISDHLYNVLRKLFEYYFALVSSCSSKNDACDMGFHTMNVDGQNHDDPPNKEQMKRFYDEFDDEDEESVVEKCELDKYLEKSKVKRVEGDIFDILGWWKEKSDKYEVLARMARDILAILVSTVSSESALVRRVVCLTNLVVAWGYRQWRL